MVKEVEAVVALFLKKGEKSKVTRKQSTNVTFEAMNNISFVVISIIY